MKKTIAVSVVALLVGAAIGYTIGLMHAMKTAVPALDFAGHSYLVKAMEAAQDAYLHEKPEIAAWALDQLAGRLDEQLRQDYESQWFPHETLKIDLMFTYARLAKTIGTQDVQRSQEYVRQAIEIGSERYKDEPFTEERLFQLLARVD